MMNGSETNVKEVVNIDGEEYLFIGYKVGNTKVSICYLVPQSEIMEQANDIRTLTVVIVIFASIMTKNNNCVISAFAHIRAPATTKVSILKNVKILVKNIERYVLPTFRFVSFT